MDNDKTAAKEQTPTKIQLSQKWDNELSDKAKYLYGSKKAYIAITLELYKTNFRE